jgi:hypothetical protein
LKQTAAFEMLHSHQECSISFFLPHGDVAAHRELEAEQVLDAFKLGQRKQGVFSSTRRSRRSFLFLSA